MQAYRPRALRALLLPLLVACSHQVVVLEPPDPGPLASARAIPLTVAVRVGSFDRSRLDPRGVLDRFATVLREAALFEGVLYPVPDGVHPLWEIELTGADEAWEPNANFWKSALASALPLALPFVKLESQYRLEIELLLVKNRVLFGTYRGAAQILHRWGPYANKNKLREEGLEAAVARATRTALGAMSEDRARIEQANHH